MFSLSVLRPICRDLLWRLVQAERSGLLESVRPGLFVPLADGRGEIDRRAEVSVCPSRRANLQYQCTICRLVNFLNPTSGQGRSKFARHLRNFCRGQCHDSPPIGRCRRRERRRFTMSEGISPLRASALGPGPFCRMGPMCRMYKRFRSNVVRPHSTIHC